MLTEVGNILLNACLGMLGNVLQVRVMFSTPRLYLDDVETLVGTVTKGSTAPQHALVVSMAFKIKQSEISGYLALVLGVPSLEAFVARLAIFEQHAESGAE
jgi:chemotaxis protein CheC